MLLPHALWVVGDVWAELLPPTVFLDGPGQVLWRWCAAEDPAMPPDHVAAFATLDECKPMQLGDRQVVVVTASWSGGVAVIDRASRRTLFSAPLPMAHSAAILPDGSLVGAGSTGCDRLLHWRLGVPEPLASIALPHAHAAVPDPRRGLLWSGGGQQVVAYDIGLEQGHPRHVIDMPDDGVHDLVWDGAGDALICSTDEAVWRIDPDSRKVVAWDPLHRMRWVKGIAPPINGGPLCFQKGEAGAWWSDTIYALAQGPVLAMVRFPGRKLYKVRWDR